jgi:uncharacterized delta-60 repeat protein
MKPTYLRTHFWTSVSLLAALLMLSASMAEGAGQVQEEWVARYNGPGNGYDVAAAIELDASGNVYVTGYCDLYGTNLSAQDWATVMYDTTGNQLWVARYNGPANVGDGASAIALDKSGNVYVTGYCDSPGTTLDADWATIKYDSVGNQLWVARYNGPGNGQDSAGGIAVDASGNVYVTGISEGSGTYVDYATVKYDTNGNQLWVRRYSGPGSRYDQLSAMALDASGNVYVTGYSPGAGPDYATVKYDTNGNQLWVARYNGPGNGWDGAYAIAVDKSGNVYVAGESERTGTKGDYATIKYDTNGNQLWVAFYSGPENGDDKVEAIALDASGNVYVTGVSPNSRPHKDYVTIKYDTNGNQLWEARYNGPGKGDDLVAAIALDVCGNVYVTGYSEGRTTARDYATIKYDTDGNQLWVARYNGPGNLSDGARAIALDASGNVYVAGGSHGSDTQSDYATIKYSQSSYVGDLDCDNDVDLADFALFAGLWLEADCGVCGGADLSGDGDVDLEDFAIFGAHCLPGVE